MSRTNTASRDIPECHEDVIVEWITQALRSRGVLVDQSEKAFKVEPISEAISRMSSLVRIIVEYDRCSENLPTSTIV